MALISIQNLDFGYDGAAEKVFDGVSFQMDTAWRLGLVGRNGRGKTTLLRLLQGQLEHGGSISSPCLFDYFPMHIPDEDETVLKYCESSIPHFEQWRLMKELSLLDVDEGAVYRSISTLSGGERTKLLLAVLFMQEEHFLLIDEPTNHLDLEGRQVLAAYLKRKSGFILVSHDRSFLDESVDHILSINPTSITVTKGDYSSFAASKERQDAFELAENQKLRKEAKRLDEAAKQTARWSDKIEATKIGTHAADRGFIGAKSAKMMKRSKVTEQRRESARDEATSLLHNIEATAALKLHPLAHHKRPLLEGKHLALYYGETCITQGIDFKLENGAITAVTGKNGAGKSTLLKLLLGQNIAHTGELLRPVQCTVSYVPQDTSFLVGALDDYIEQRAVDRTLTKAILRKLGFSRPQFELPMERYSAGQRKKVLLAASLAEPAHLYVWDEPLNYVDLISRLQIEALLKEFSPTMVLVEHDRAFLESVNSNTIRLERC